MKKVLLSLATLFLMTSLFGIAFAGYGFANSPIWQPCNTTTSFTYVQSATAGVAGATYVSITYTAPPQDYDWFIVCAREPFYNITFSVYVYSGLTFEGSGVVTTGAVGGVVGVPLIKCLCNPQPIHLSTGEHITVDISVRYDVGIFYHNGGYGFTV